tara:strand:- start:1520 stop:1672 length:153 start_codon:yes stop_codon:yes gene_type:complete
MNENKNCAAALGDAAHLLRVLIATGASERLPDSRGRSQALLGGSFNNINR